MNLEPTTVLLILLSLALVIWVLLYRRALQAVANIPVVEEYGADGATPAEGEMPSVSILVPARNEETDLPDCLRSLLDLDYPDYEIVLVDDGSCDGTLETAERMAASEPRLRVVRGRMRPAGWIGKTWAVWQAAREARGEWVLLTDADVWHAPGSLRHAMAAVRGEGADAVSVLPRIQVESVWDKLMMPLFGVLMSIIWRLDRANDPDRPEALMAGGYILVRRDLYEQCDGHRRIRGEILEDMALARLWKSVGADVRTLSTRGMVRTRMYESFHDLWTGLGRHSYPSLDYSAARVLWATLATIYFVWLPYASAVAAPVMVAVSDTPFPWLGVWIVAAFVVAVQWAVFRPVMRALDLPSGYGLTAPASTFLYVVITLRSVWMHHFGGGIRWKGLSCRPPGGGDGDGDAAVDSDSDGVLARAVHETPALSQVRGPGAGRSTTDDTDGTPNQIPQGRIGSGQAPGTD